MADRYYLPAEQVKALQEVLDAAEGHSPDLVADVRRLVFATEIPDDMADEIEREMENAATGLSI